MAEDLSNNEAESNTEVFWIDIGAVYYKADNSFNNSTGHDEVYFTAGVNTDYGYGREKGLILTFEETHRADSLTPEIVKAIMEKMANTL